MFCILVPPIIWFFFTWKAALVVCLILAQIEWGDKVGLLPLIVLVMWAAATVIL